MNRFIQGSEMEEDNQLSLSWNNFNSNFSAGFYASLSRGDLVDVTLAAEGQLVKAHRLVLSVCSPYFRKMFTQMPANQHAFGKFQRLRNNRSINSTFVYLHKFSLRTSAHRHWKNWYSSCIAAKSTSTKKLCRRSWAQQKRCKSKD